MAMIKLMEENPSVLALMINALHRKTGMKLILFFARWNATKHSKTAYFVFRITR